MRVGRDLHDHSPGCVEGTDACPSGTEGGEHREQASLQGAGLVTTLGERKPGDKLNIEIKDRFGKFREITFETVKPVGSIDLPIGAEIAEMSSPNARFSRQAIVSALLRPLSLGQ